MEVKLFKIYDRCTEIRAIAIRMVSDNDREHNILRASGYSNSPICTLVSMLNSSCATAYESYAWEDRGSRTMSVAHEYIDDNWNSLITGDSIDVEKILGEKPND